MKIPQIGLGMWKIDRNCCADIVVEAIRLGYRHFDCASDYGNEKEVGDGLQAAISQGLCRREDLWITSKLWNTNHKKEHVQPALKRTLSDLQLDYLDLYLIHFPISLRHVPPETRYPAGWVHDPDSKNPTMVVDPVPVSETWAAMEKQKISGLTKNIGVSNFSTSLITDLMSYATIPPAVLQVESHPYLTQEKLKRLCELYGILFTAFSPLGAGSYVPLNMAKESESVLQTTLVNRIADKYTKTNAQIVLRWAIQRDSIVIPKSSRPERLAENLALFDFELTDREMAEISNLNCNKRYNDPGVFCEKQFGTFFPIFD